MNQKKTERGCCDLVFAQYYSNDSGLDAIDESLLRKSRIDAIISASDAGFEDLAKRIEKQLEQDMPPCMCDCHRVGSEKMH